MTELTSVTDREGEGEIERQTDVRKEQNSLIGTVSLLGVFQCSLKGHWHTVMIHTHEVVLEFVVTHPRLTVEY